MKEFEAATFDKETAAQDAENNRAEQRLTAITEVFAVMCK
jgi:hypothetical protein